MRARPEREPADSGPVHKPSARPRVHQAVLFRDRLGRHVRARGGRFPLCAAVDVSPRASGRDDPAGLPRAPIPAERRRSPPSCRRRWCRREPNDNCGRVPTDATGEKQEKPGTHRAGQPGCGRRPVPHAPAACAPSAAKGAGGRTPSSFLRCPCGQPAPALMLTRTGGPRAWGGLPHPAYPGRYSVSCRFWCCRIWPLLAPGRWPTCSRGDRPACRRLSACCSRSGTGGHRLRHVPSCCGRATGRALALLLCCPAAGTLNWFPYPARRPRARCRPMRQPRSPYRRGRSRSGPRSFNKEHPWLNTRNTPAGSVRRG